MDDDIETLHHSTVPHYPELKGRVAVVTGSAQGFGQGIAVRLAREDRQVAIADKDEEKLASTVSALRQLGATVLGFHGELSQSDVIRELFKQTIETFHNIHLLDNNVADIQRGRLLDEHEALLDQPLASNIRGLCLCYYRAAKWMQASSVGALSISHRLEACVLMKWGCLMTLPRAPLML